MVNHYPRWKNYLLIVLAILGIVYALPNLFGEDPAIQVNGSSNAVIDNMHLQQVTSALNNNHIEYKSTEITDQQILVRFKTSDDQLRALDIVKASLAEGYTTALNLAPATPHWLTAIGATPAKLGLDLRGGVHFLLDVDVNAVIALRLDGTVKNIRNAFHDAKVRYLTADLRNNIITLQFRDTDNANLALSVMRRQFPDLILLEQKGLQSNWQLSPQALSEVRQYAIDQTMTTLRNRVNELGVAEAVVQQQGIDRVSVDLPGILDTARAKQILGGTATLEFRLVDTTHDPRSISNGIAPLGTQLYQYNSTPILLQERVVLTGNSITDASASFGEDGRPSVSISLGGGGEAQFHRITGDNVGKPLAIVFVETKFSNQVVNGQTVKIPHKTERVISAPIIQTALGNNFQITGLRDPQEARDLALLLRAGALLAPISIAEERTVGPQLGMENIHMGILSVIVGVSLIGLFIAAYYRLFGLIADLALLLNLVFLVALLSLCGATLTLPGIAGIVLTMGMAVDANVLIFERIREEMRNGASPQASIHAGYERAFSTIVDANVTTLIVALVLFGLGTGPVKGFAVTLSIGILTSMLTGITFTRGVVNAIYGQRSVSKLSIGI